MRDFKLRAIEAKYIMYFQEVMRVLYDESKKPNFEKPDEPTPPPITCCPDIRKLIYKINLKNWKNNPVEKLYLEPLHKSFKALQKELWLMWHKGINYWKIPLYENDVMI